MKNAHVVETWKLIIIFSFHVILLELYGLQERLPSEQTSSLKDHKECITRSKITHHPYYLYAGDSEADYHYVVPLESSNELRFNKKEWKASNVLHAVMAISNPYLTHYHTRAAKSTFCAHPATKYSTTTQQHAPTFFRNKMLQAGLGILNQGAQQATS